MEPQLSSLTIFFPCHNEAENVAAVTHKALAVGRALTADLEVLIVNDGSTDRTADVAEALAAQHPEVRVIHHPTNLGYGAALQSGFGSATKEWIFYTDGDGQFDIADLPHLLALSDPQTIVSAYRLQRQDSVFRRINAWCWCALVNRMFGMRVRDIDCAFKLFPAKLFSGLELRAKGALIDTEVLAKAVRLGYGIRQVGVAHYPRTAGFQSGANLAVIARAFRELWALRKHIRQTLPPVTGAAAARATQSHRCS